MARLMAISAARVTRRQRPSIVAQARSAIPAIIPARTKGPRAARNVGSYAKGRMAGRADLPGCDHFRC